MTYTITIEKREPNTGLLAFVSGGIHVNCTCWYKHTTPIERGITYTGAATRMTTKSDSVTGERRPGIFLKEFGKRGIFIHEGEDVSWSDNCIVLPREEMMKIWDHIVMQKDGEKFLITVNVT
jgi:hypothetical protein